MKIFFALWNLLRSQQSNAPIVKRWRAFQIAAVALPAHTPQLYPRGMALAWLFVKFLAYSRYFLGYPCMPLVSPVFSCLFPPYIPDILYISHTPGVLLLFFVHFPVYGPPLPAISNHINKSCA